MKIDCLMGTYGRYSLASEALACFLQQSALCQASLLIYNQHPVPLQFDHPRVRVVNEVLPAAPIHYIRQRMHQLADPAAEFIHFWDDDDLYLPWHLEDCLNHIGDGVAWKPASSWMSERNDKFSRQMNRFRGIVDIPGLLLKTTFLHTHPTYTVFHKTEDAGLLAKTELGGNTSYIYRWDTGTQHLSGYGGHWSEALLRSSVKSWRRHSNDVSLGPLVPADMTLRWQQYLDGTRDLVSHEEWELNRKRLGL